MAYMSTWRSPVLLIQGDDDRNVPFSQTVSLATAQKARRRIEELVFPDEIHGFLLQRSWLAAYTAEADFFQRHLMSPKLATQSSNIELGNGLKAPGADANRIRLEHRNRCTNDLRNDTIDTDGPDVSRLIDSKGNVA